MDNILTHVHTVLTTTPAHWQSLTQALSPELLKQPPLAGEWSAHECLQHLVDAERWVFPVRVQAFLNGQDFPAFDPDSQGTKPETSLPPAELAAEFARLRAESLKAVTPLTVADLPRRARHSELGPVTLDELLHEWAAHDLMHTVQAERALMQPFIRGAGPWLKYFSDHVAR